ncbi:cytochrome P450 [Roseinatronobacter thiooxidans]|uniref:Cytochrome P450 n=1 Tax=Roseinatronobacter thiooxidans TaxID=121821 RepID=A0A2W7QDX4_9RHOB|nr:cytochrome P450 [Roseinatronobacter thiooxidans]PZX45616.1 cytochrome P450 [Roseinatronobacter thiooxidans]
MSLSLPEFSQNPLDAGFVQDPYPAYDRMRTLGSLVYWQDYNMPCAVSYAAANAILRDRRFGRMPLDPPEVPAHLAPFYAVEAHSMLELEPPRHTRLRSLVLRAFTSRRIVALAPEISALSHQLIDQFPDGPFDLLTRFAQPLPVTIIARLLGVPENLAPDLLRWSNAMVGMYQAGRTRADEDRAITATTEFVDFMRGYIAARRQTPRDDLITHLIAAEEEGERLSTDEMISTCILLLNAGHEATVHSIGNAAKTLLQTGHYGQTPITDALVEETLRYDPPLHLFTRWAYEDIDVVGHVIPKGTRIACLLGAANRCPKHWDTPHRFDATRSAKANLAFGAGLHFCLGAPLARLELVHALGALAARLPGLSLVQTPLYADIYHFHGLNSLMVEVK